MFETIKNYVVEKLPYTVSATLGYPAIIGGLSLIRDSFYEDTPAIIGSSMLGLIGGGWIDFQRYLRHRRPQPEPEGNLNEWEEDFFE